MEKSKVGRNVVYKIIVPVLLISMLGFCGCGRVEPEKRAFAQVVSIDYLNDKYKVSLGLPNLKNATGQEKEEVSEGEEISENVYEGTTLEQLQGIYADEENKTLDLGHVQVVILGEGLLENPQAYRYMLNKIEEDNLICESVYVLRSNELDQVMKLNGTKIDSLGEYLEDMIKKNDIGETKLEDLYYAWHENQVIPELASVSCMNKTKVVVKE